MADAAIARRWIAFRLSSLLLAVIVAASFLGWVAYERRISRFELTVAERLKARGATVFMTGLLNTEVSTDPDEPADEPTWWRRVLSGLCGQRIRAISSNENPDIDNLASLADLTCLEQLFLNEGPVRDLSPLAALHRLRFLSLRSSAVQSLAPLARASSLEALWIDGTRVTDLSPLAGLEKLESLSCSGTRVVDLSPLARLPNLAVLRLDGTRVKDLAPLAELTSLVGLNLDDTPVTDLAPLYGITELRELRLQGTNLSDSQLHEVQKALPRCQVFSGAFGDRRGPTRELDNP